MPKLTKALGEYGPMVEVRLWQQSRVSNIITGVGLIDTGASHTSIDGIAAMNNGFREGLSLLPSRIFTAGGSKDSKWYSATIEILDLEGGYIKTLAMPEFAGKGQPADNTANPFVALIGRNILSAFRLTYNDPPGFFTLDLK